MKTLDLYGYIIFDNLDEINKDHMIEIIEQSTRVKTLRIRREKITCLVNKKQGLYIPVNLTGNKEVTDILQKRYTELKRR